ncbi:MAG: sporulation transcriptional regulator SpoIIID [Clostridia bacterium]|nr:sporulation transcriptional regulator SpoIIID [Clostridia bacterium]
MKTYSAKERCEILGEYLVQTRATVRSAALHFSISKSTVHKDVTTRLKKVNPKLYLQVKEILEQNKSERHLRGGEATRQKYLQKAIAKQKKKFLAR